MQTYLSAVVVMNFLVDFLLILGTNRLCGYPPSAGKAALGAALGGVYAGACLLPSFAFLGNTLWRIVFLALTSSLAFGTTKPALRRGVVLVLLTMALGGVAMGISTQNAWKLLLAALGVLALCVVGFDGRIGGRTFVPVELSYGSKSICLTALQDTGNMLRDPVSGAQVIVVGADIAQKLTGLTREQLNSPIESIGLLPGLRLIPYRSIGQKGGLLLALKLPQVRIGRDCGSRLVAFAPEGLSVDGEYQALTGGAL